MQIDPFQQGDSFDPLSLVWVFDEHALKRLKTAIRGASEVVLDLETTGLDQHATGRNPAHPVPARISMISFTLPQRSNPMHPTPSTFVVPLSHPEGPFVGSWRKVMTELAEVMAECDVPITNHNLKFDLKWIYASTGVDLSHLLAWDTQISSHLLDENSSTRLKQRVPDTFGVEAWDDDDLSSPGASERVPIFRLGLYAARDTYWTWRLALAHRILLGVNPGQENSYPETSEEILEHRLGQLAVWCAMPTVATLTEIEQRGMLMARPWVEKRIAESEKARDAAHAKLVNRYTPEHDHPEGAREIEYRKTCSACLMSGDPSFAPTSKWFMEWSQQAVLAGDLRITSTTKTGKPQWDKAVLTKQARAGSQVATDLLDLRQHAKDLEFLKSWLNVQTPAGTVHTTYHSGRVLTGRLSSSDPNVQQITGRLKPAFIPRPGYLIAELDYSQIELRAAAHIAQCEPMIQAFNEGRDLHTMLASRITSLPEDQVTRDSRQAGKSANFGLLYGMSAGGFQEYADAVYGVAFTSEEAHNVRELFFEQWVGMEEWHHKSIRDAVSRGYVVSPIGRVRRLPAIRSGNSYLEGHAERQAINSPVQSFASDMMQMAAASIAGRLPGTEPVPGALLIGTVHDSVVVEVPEDDWKITTARCMRRMLDLDRVLHRLDCELTVPLAVEASVGTRWGLSDVGVIT